MGRYKARELNYKNGLLHGKTTHWEEPTLHLKSSEINYKNNLLHGKSITWYGNFEKESECNYKNGKKDGKFICWYYNKQKKSEEIYENGVLKDKPLYWYPNGKKKDAYVAELEIEDEEEWGQNNIVSEFLSEDEFAEYEKNYEGYDKWGDGTVESDPQYGAFDDLGLTDDERSLGRNFWNDIM
jgi:antitoxin component YwqK of YwqJK toxin-antitoxin module